MVQEVISQRLAEAVEAAGRQLVGPGTSFAVPVAEALLKSPTFLSVQAAKALYPQASQGETVSDIAGRRYAEEKLGTAAYALSPSDVRDLYHKALLTDPVRALAQLSDVEQGGWVPATRARRKRFRAGLKAPVSSPAQKIVRTAMKAGLVSRNKKGQITGMGKVTKAALKKAAKKRRVAELAAFRKRQKTAKRRLTKGFRV